MFRKKQKPDLIFTAADVKGFDQKSAERAFARLFSTEDGQKVLAHLQAMTFHRALGPKADNDHLRYLEGQRGLVTQILRLIEGGRRA